MSDDFNVEELKSKLLLGLIKLEDLPRIAMNGLSNSSDSDELVQLAICNEGDIDEIERLFDALQINTSSLDMSKIQALRVFAVKIASSIIAGNIAPYDGSRLIWQASINASITGFHELDGFIYAASEMEDRPLDKDFFEQAILKEAKNLLDVYGSS